MKTKMLPIAAALTMLCGAQGPSDPGSWTFTQIDVPGGVSTRAQDMNAQGQIVGEYQATKPDDTTVDRGFLLSNGVFTPIEIGQANGVRGINQEGTMVGWFVGSDGVSHGFVRHERFVTQIDYPGADYTIAEAINDAGEIVGFYGMGGTEHGFLLHRGASIPITVDYPNAPLTNARGINSEGDIVGLYYDDTQGSTTDHGFIWGKHGTITAIDYPGGVVSTNADAINARGQIVGSYRAVTGQGNRNGFLLTEGSFFSFAYPGATTTNPLGIAPNGQHIVGAYRGSDNKPHGFLMSRSSR